MNKAKKVLVIVDSIDVNDSSGSKVNVALILNLSKVGYEVIVYHYTRKEIYLEGVNCIAIPERKWNLLYFLSRAQRIFTRVTEININPFIEGLFGFSFTFFNDVNSIRTTLEKIKNINPVMVFTLSKGASFRPHKALLSISKWHPIWMAYIHDPYPMHSYPRPYDWVEPGHQFKRNFFLEIVNKAKYLIYPSKLLAEWMQGYYKNQKGKEIIIPHQISKEVIEANLLPSYFNIQNFNLLHAGNMMSTRNPTSLIVAFERFLTKRPLVKKHAGLIFIGNDSHFDEFIREKQKTIPQLLLSNGYVPFKTVLAMQHFTSVNIILESTGPISPFLPGKFPHCIQAKKPILLLCPYYSESRRLLGKDYSYWSSIDEIDKIQSNIEKIYDQWVQQKNQLNMDRKDLIFYLSEGYLRETINKLNV